jgi:SAM-dependent methyltransferase
MSQERYGTNDDEVDIERVRLGYLAECRDPKTFEVLAKVGIGTGMRVLEVGAGAGTVSAWMAGQVGDGGVVVSTDIDLQFHNEMPANVEVRQHDIENDELETDSFDIVHARAVLQHTPTREQVVEKLASAVKPGGWLVLEDGQFIGFGEQDVDEPYRTIHRIVAGGAQEEWRDPNFGLQLLDRMRRLGFEDLDAVGDVWAMRPNEASGEWWFMALERAIPRLVEFELVTEADGAAALVQVREPGFVMLSSTSIAAMGRKPG